MMPDRIDLENITIVLQKPRYPENIGAAARAMCNMGIRHLSIVNPERCDLTRILRMATHVGADIIEEMEVFDDLPRHLGHIPISIPKMCQHRHHQDLFLHHFSSGQFQEY